MISIERKTSRFSLKMDIVRLGKDLSVCLYGGDVPHIGAVAMATPHPGLSIREKTDASVSLLAVTGHKEDQVARKVAYTLAVHVDATISVTCGIHLDDATEVEISQVLKVVDILLEQALEELQIK